MSDVPNGDLTADGRPVAKVAQEMEAYLDGFMLNIDYASPLPQGHNSQNGDQGPHGEHGGQGTPPPPYNDRGSLGGYVGQVNQTAPADKGDTAAPGSRSDAKEQAARQLLTHVGDILKGLDPEDITKVLTQMAQDGAKNPVLPTVTIVPANPGEIAAAVVVRGTHEVVPPSAISIVVKEQGGKTHTTFDWSVLPPSAEMQT